MKVPALPVRQWLSSWDLTRFDKEAYASRPERQFYLFTMPAGMLARLCHVHRRGGDDASAERINPLAIQRHLNKERTAEIKNFIERGYPWSELSQRKQKSDQYDTLVRPGWLPTALVINILKKGETRQDRKLHNEDVVDVSHKGGITIDVPDAAVDVAWKPRGLAPMEVIDGQHRLKALEDATTGEGYDLPVVAFHGLDISWQAYLFYTINIKPKKLNASLAFDLFPLLRSQEWLETGGELKVYRETRAQELVEVFSSHSQSPWHKHINMLGAPGKPNMVSQAAWIRTLVQMGIVEADWREIQGIIAAGGAAERPVFNADGSRKMRKTSKRMLPISETDLPGERAGHILHMRPHTDDADDKVLVPGGEITAQCFWLNKGFVHSLLLANQDGLGARHGIAGE